MARKPRADFCMLCGNSPCTCNGPAKKAVKKSAAPRSKKSAAPKPSSPVEEVPVAPVAFDPREAMRQAAAAASGVGPVQEVARPVQQEAELDAETVRAVRLLYPILHPDEQQRFAAVASTSARAASWRERRGES